MTAWIYFGKKLAIDNPCSCVCMWRKDVHDRTMEISEFPRVYSAICIFVECRVCKARVHRIENLRIFISKVFVRIEKCMIFMLNDVENYVFYFANWTFIILCLRNVWYEIELFRSSVLKLRLWFGSFYKFLLTIS